MYLVLVPILGTAVSIGKGHNLWVNSLTKKRVVRRTTMPHFLVALTHFLVDEDTKTLEFCYPDNLRSLSDSIKQTISFL